MSYSVSSNCWNCESQEDCTDQAKVQESVEKIHENSLGEGGHLGSGSIIIQCSRLKAKD